MGETIEQGHMKGEEACCLAAICLPLAFTAGRTPNVVVVTMSRDEPDIFPLAKDDGHMHNFKRIDDNYVVCLECGYTKERAL